ncbi:MAG: glycosyltransferase family 2 protein [Arenicella sp.]
MLPTKGVMADEARGDETIAAIVVTYQPNLKALQANIEAIIHQVDYLVVVDNGSNNQAHMVGLLKRLSFPRLMLRCLKENQGIGAAHNHGIALAKEHHCDYVLLLDQDSQASETMVNSLYSAVQQLKSSGEFDSLAAVGPRYTGEGMSESFFVKFGWMKFQRHYCHDCDHGIVAADFLISSGSLMPMQAIEKNGDMDAGLFIDHVDTEWFLRAKSNGLQAYGVCQAVMSHGLGEQSRTVKFLGFGRQRHVPQHKPFRYYYMFRNSVTLYRRNYVSRRWLWNDLQRLFQIFVFYGICYGPRIQNLRMMWKGIRDGFARKNGQLAG